MKTIIAGSRDGIVYTDLINALHLCGFKNQITEIVSGGARGADSYGENYAKDFNIPLKIFPAKWRVNGVYDPSAGYKRNVEMARYADACIVLWNGKSRGSKHMIKTAQDYELKLYIWHKYV